MATKTNTKKEVGKFLEKYLKSICCFNTHIIMIITYNPINNKIKIKLKESNENNYNKKQIYAYADINTHTHTLTSASAHAFRCIPRIMQQHNANAMQYSCCAHLLLAFAVLIQCLLLLQHFTTPHCQLGWTDFGGKQQL